MKGPAFDPDPAMAEVSRLRKQLKNAEARAEAAERQVQIEGAAADANGRDARAAEAQRDELLKRLQEAGLE